VGADGGIIVINQKNMKRVPEPTECPTPQVVTFPDSKNGKTETRKTGGGSRKQTLLESVTLTSQGETKKEGRCALKRSGTGPRKKKGDKQELGLEVIQGGRVLAKKVGIGGRNCKKGTDEGKGKNERWEQEEPGAEGPLVCGKQTKTAKRKHLSFQRTDNGTKLGGEKKCKRKPEGHKQNG